MRIVASMMILILMTSTLAGCVDSVENDILDESTQPARVEVINIKIIIGATIRIHYLLI
jgi:hypothetical protein